MSIKYKLCTNYEKLFRLIDDGIIIIGFVQRTDIDYVSDLPPERKEVVKIVKDKTRTGSIGYFIETPVTCLSRSEVIVDLINDIKKHPVIDVFKEFCKKWKVEYIDI